MSQLGSAYVVFSSGTHVRAASVDALLAKVSDANKARIHKLLTRNVAAFQRLAMRSSAV